MGVDISTGAEASNSVASIGDKLTNEKVLEYVSKVIRPEMFADLCVFLAKWFAGLSGGAFMIWEANGPGGNFGARVVELGYTNFYFRRNEQSLSQTETDVPGFWSNPQTKLTIMSNLRRAYVDNKFINHSIDSLEELRQFVHTKNSTVKHVRESSAIEESAKNANHGDMVTADALCWKGLCEIAELTPEAAPLVMPEHCVARRMLEHMRETAMAGRW